MAFSNVSDDSVLSPSPEIESNFSNPPSQETLIIGMGTALVALMVLAVTIRIWVRIRILKIWGADDTTILPAACGAISFIVIYTQGFQYGLGRHVWDVPKSMLSPRLTLLVSLCSNETPIRQTINEREVLIANTTYPFTACFTKLSILLLYRRLFPVHRERYAIWTGIWLFTILYSVLTILSAIRAAKCDNNIPWTNPQPYCTFAATTLAKWTSVLNVLSDFYVLLLPIPAIVALKLSVRRKVGVLVVFASGLCVCAASLARLIHLFIDSENHDFFWNEATIALSGMNEINIGIIVACANTFPAFIGCVRSWGCSMAEPFRTRRARQLFLYL
ncbi:uncharacterized protein BO80DRAFT_403124 [Aspergillus ibericus CBS 121593]|uniref:Rhodopsin domain-containing protein n=1 Tax=Aspergillus ibericus CBS 121593 TaxID=1448316 RepID=A0A395H5Y6_9EURO|nr:hypothetical protein BO80DRAFT_403124 [Aspergillus ibericus CBS 121593]RAL02565.1 hypothetical protein BO80DRAFT_403124 [Aspergillus ibericus CBS 121593]